MRARARPLISRFFFLVALLSCGGSESVLTRATSIASLTGDATAGQTIYTQECTTCHGTDGLTGSAHHNIVSPAKSAATRAATTLLSGEDEMPSFSALSDEQLAAVIAYVKTL